MSTKIHQIDQKALIAPQRSCSFDCRWRANQITYIQWMKQGFELAPTLYGIYIYAVLLWLAFKDIGAQ